MVTAWNVMAESIEQILSNAKRLWSSVFAVLSLITSSRMFIMQLDESNSLSFVKHLYYIYTYIYICVCVCVM